MCVVFLGFQTHPLLPLVLAFNRDEVISRPSARAEFWRDQPEILAGRDLEAGGTWGGISRSGRFAVLTNHRDGRLKKSALRSRGEVVSGFLATEEAPELFLAKLKESAGKFAPYHLIVGNRREAWSFESLGRSTRRLEPGVFGLSNDLLETPWPKVVEGKRRFAASLAGGAVDEEAIFGMLADETTVDEARLPNTGIELSLERALSAIFVKIPGYGTRSSTLVRFGTDGNASFTERTFDDLGFAGEARFEIGLRAER